MVRFYFLYSLIILTKMINNNPKLKIIKTLIGPLVKLNIANVIVNPRTIKTILKIKENNELIFFFFKKTTFFDKWKCDNQLVLNQRRKTRCKAK